MRFGFPAGLVLLSGLGLACPATAGTFSLTSPDIAEGARIHEEQVLDGNGCRGRNLSPALAWSDAPAETRSLALTLVDPDAPGGSFVHWIVLDIPAKSSGLAKGAGAPAGGSAPEGAVQGQNDFGRIGYSGPCPPKGDPQHHYVLTLYALDTEHLAAAAGASGADIAAALAAHAIARATLTGVWGR